MIELLLALIVAHFLADYPLQGDFLASAKTRVGREAMGAHALTAHAAIQGGVCGLAAALLGHPWMLVLLIVAGTHWLIDLGKIRDWYGINTDQAAHGLVLAAMAAVIA